MEYNLKSKNAKAIYDHFINKKGCDFWGTPSLKGLAVMRKCVAALSKLGPGVFSGHPEWGWTFTTVAERIEQITRRLDRWTDLLTRHVDNNIKVNLERATFSGKLPALAKANGELNIYRATDGLVKVDLFLKGARHKGKDRVALYGEVKELDLTGKVIKSTSSILGHHAPNEDGENTIEYSVSIYTLMSLADAIMYPNRLGAAEQVA